MSDASDWLSVDDQAKVLVDISGFTDINDRSGISIAAITGYDEDVRSRIHDTERDGILEGGLHLPADRGFSPSREVDYWGFNAPLIEIPKESKTTTVAPSKSGARAAGSGGGASNNVLKIGGLNIGGALGLNVGLGLSGGGSSFGKGLIQIGKRGGAGFFGPAKPGGGIKITPPKAPAAGGGGKGSPATGGVGGAIPTGTPGASAPPPKARKFKPINSMKWDKDDRFEEVVMHQKSVGFPFCAKKPIGLVATPPSSGGKPPQSARGASNDFSGPHSFNEFSAPWPGGNPVLMTRATAEESLEYLAWRPWQNVTIAHHRGDTDPEYSTRMVDIDDKNEIGEAIAGYHSAFKVEEVWDDHCGISMFWGVREKDEDDVGRGLFTTSGEFGRNQDPDAQFMGYAGESGGGPISAGTSDGDKHFVGRNSKGTPINQGHLWLKAPWYFSPFHDAPPAFDPTGHSIDGFAGADWPVFLYYDDNGDHEIQGVRAAPGQRRKGLMKWYTPMPFLFPPKREDEPPPIPLPPLEPPWWWPKPLWEPVSKPFGEEPPPWGEPGEFGDPAPTGDVGPLLSLSRLVTSGVYPRSAPSDEYEEDTSGRPAFVAKYMDNRPLGLSFEEAFSDNCSFEKAAAENIRLLKNLGSKVHHWNEQSPTSFAFKPVHVGQIESGLQDLRYSRDLSKGDRALRILRAPTVLRADAWGAERGNRFDLVNGSGHARNDFGDANGGLCFYPPNRGIRGVDVGEEVHSIVAFDGVCLDLASPLRTGDNAGSTSDGFRFKLNPSKDVLIIARQDSSGGSIENTTLNEDGDFNTAGDVVTGGAFENPVAIHSPPGMYSAAKGETVEVLTGLGVGSVRLPDPTGALGAWVIVKDGDGSASTNNITIDTTVGLLNGAGSASSMTVAEYRRSVKFQSDGTNWVIVADTHASPFVSPDRLITISRSGDGADFDNIADAITAAGSLSPVPSAGNPCVIYMYPGSYSADPFVLTAGINLVGAGREAVQIEAADSDDCICEMQAYASISHLSLHEAVDSNGVGLGFYDGSSALHLVRDVDVAYCYKAVDVSGGTTATIEDSVLLDTERWSIYTAISSDEVVLTDVVYQPEFVRLASGSEIIGTGRSVDGGQDKFEIRSDISAGQIAAPRSAAFGGGAATMKGLEVFKNTNLEVGTWSSITNNMRNFLGSVDSLFTSTGVGASVYFGADDKFYGVYSSIVTTLLIGSGAIVWEIWNGSSWYAINVSATDREEHESNGDEFWQFTGEQDARFGLVGSWSQKSLNGTTKYWARARIATAVTRTPTSQFIRLHPDYSSFYEDGALEYFGSARPYRALGGVHLSLAHPLVSGAGADSDVLYSSTVKAAALANEFQNGAIDGLVSSFVLPDEVDTSFEVDFIVHWYAAATTGTEIVALSLEIGDAPVVDSSKIDGTLGETQYDELIEAKHTADLLKKTTFSVDLSDRKPGDLIPWSLFRDATGATSPTGDDYSDSIVVVSISAIARFWR